MAEQAVGKIIKEEIATKVAGHPGSIVLMTLWNVHGEDHILCSTCHTWLSTEAEVEAHAADKHPGVVCAIGGIFGLYNYYRFSRSAV